MPSTSTFSRVNRGGATRRVLLLPLLASVAIVVSGCCTKPEGRCGIADMCDPVVMADPFPNDQCVPPKGVDCGHYGYVRTTWRVLNPREPNCCTMEPPCCEPIPVGAESIDFQAILNAPEQTDSLAIAPVETDSSASDASYIRESFDVVREALAIEPTDKSKLR